MASNLIIPFLWIAPASNLHVYLICTLSSTRNISLPCPNLSFLFIWAGPSHCFGKVFPQIPSLRGHLCPWCVLALSEACLAGWAVTLANVLPVSIPRATISRDHVARGQIIVQLWLDLHRWVLLTWWVSLYMQLAGIKLSSWELCGGASFLLLQLGLPLL